MFFELSLFIGFIIGFAVTGLEEILTHGRIYHWLCGDNGDNIDDYN